MERYPFLDTDKLFALLDIEEDKKDQALQITRARIRDLLLTLRHINRKKAPVLVGEGPPKTTVPLMYSMSEPTTYQTSSELSPDRRRFYLSGRASDRQVSRLGTRALTKLTEDPRYPIDLCCFHMGSENPMLVYFSSKIVNVAKVSDQMSFADNLGVSAKIKLLAEGAALNVPSIVARLPRRTERRYQKGYNKIPLTERGELLLDPDSYPYVTEPDLFLDTNTWYGIFTILGVDYPMRFGLFSTLLSQEEKEIWFTVQNPYHLVIQRIKVITVEDSQRKGDASGT